MFWQMKTVEGCELHVSDNTSASSPVSCSLAQSGQDGSFDLLSGYALTMA